MKKLYTLFTSQAQNLTSAVQRLNKSNVIVIIKFITKAINSERNAPLVFFLVCNFYLGGKSCNLAICALLGMLKTYRAACLG